LKWIELSATTAGAKVLMVFEAFPRQVFTGPAFTRNQLAVSVQLHAAPLTQVPEQDQ
jgi:hypothetical protein